MDPSSDMGSDPSTVAGAATGDTICSCHVPVEAIENLTERRQKRKPVASSFGRRRCEPLAKRDQLR
jgi:hypothetical protein